MSREYRLHSMSEGWWQVCGRLGLRHTVFGTVRRDQLHGWIATTAENETKTYLMRKNAAQWVADQWVRPDETKAPVQVDHQAWEYKGWSFHARTVLLNDGRHTNCYPVHGPGSNGKRARKVCHSYADAVAYIDSKVRA